MKILRAQKIRLSIHHCIKNIEKLSEKLNIICEFKNTRIYSRINKKSEKKKEKSKDTARILREI